MAWRDEGAVMFDSRTGARGVAPRPLDVPGRRGRPRRGGAATADVRRDPNKIHRETYCAPIRAGNPSAAAAHALLADRFAGVIEDAHGYAVCIA